MGKIPRRRAKLRALSENRTSETNKEFLIKPEANLFEGVNINTASLCTKLQADDTVSVKSFKSVKSESGSKILPKKDKLKLRRESLMKKFEILSEKLKPKKFKKKSKNSILDEFKSLKDELPSIHTSKKSNNKKSRTSRKKRGIEKSKNIKSAGIDAMKLYQKNLRNKNLTKDPKEAVSQHIEAILSRERNI